LSLVEYLPQIAQIDLDFYMRVPEYLLQIKPALLLPAALGIGVESPQRGTSEDLEQKARPAGQRPTLKDNIADEYQIYTDQV
jgi:hypothetical protein